MLIANKHCLGEMKILAMATACEKCRFVRWQLPRRNVDSRNDNQQSLNSFKKNRGSYQRHPEFQSYTLPTEKPGSAPENHV